MQDCLLQIGVRLKSLTQFVNNFNKTTKLIKIVLNKFNFKDVHIFQCWVADNKIEICIYRYKDTSYLEDAFGVNPLYLKHDHQGKVLDFRVSVLKNNYIIY